VLVSKQGESGFGRLQAFGQAIEAWETRPLTGIGLGNFGPYIKYYPVETPPSGWDIVNNEYLETLAETGLLGLASLFLVLAVVLLRSYSAYKRSDNEYLRAVLVGLTAAFVAIFTQYNFFSTLYIIHIWVLLGLIVGVQNIILAPQRLPADVS
jgi:O-antigen ligase